MGRGNWRYKWGSRKLVKGVRRKAARQRSKALRVEPLEDRRMLATFVVQNGLDVDDEGNAIVGSFRQAVELANAEDNFDVIVFSEFMVDFENNFAAGQILLDGGPIDIEQPVRIIGPGPGDVSPFGFPLGTRGLTISQFSPESRIFNIPADISVEISGLTLTGGLALGDDDEGRGGAIFNEGRLRMTETAVVRNNSQLGGGGIYNAPTGSLNIDRSLFLANIAGGSGGGILNGAEGDEDDGPVTTIRNSTISGNIGGGGEMTYGGGVYNRNGTVNISHSTISENISYYGAGVASRGNPPAEDGDEPPPPVVFTNIDHSIISGNIPDDVSTVGVMEDGDEVVRLAPSIASGGYNIFQLVGYGVAQGDGDMNGVDPILKPLDDYGGSTITYHPNEDPDDPEFSGVSPAIDAGSADLLPSPFLFEQRGRHFTRVDLDGMLVDIGAVEVQQGSFVVDALIDESDGQYSQIYEVIDPLPPPLILVPGQPYTAIGDFSLREAVEFAEKNPLPDTITFSPTVIDLPDPTGSVAPTVLLSLRSDEDRDSALQITGPLTIQGPTGFELEIDAGGIDPTPTLQNADGARLFRIDDGELMETIDVTFANVTLLGGDVIDTGGAIFNRENLTLQNVNVVDNFASNNGGGVYSQLGALSLDGASLIDNFAGNNGGGLFLDMGIEQPGLEVLTTAVVTNSTVSGNLAGNRGGGIYNYDGELLIEFSTITANEAASTQGSGVMNSDRDVAKTEVRGSIISANSISDIDTLFGTNNVTSLGYNLIGTGNASFVFTEPGDQTGVVDPMLAPISNTGGGVLTHRPIAGSPAVDAGDPTADPGDGGVPMFDGRNDPFMRVFDGLEDGESRIDIGAYEVQPTTFVVDNPFDENDGDVSMGNLSLREAIAIANANPAHDFIEFSDELLGLTIQQSEANSFSGELLPGTPTDIRITDSLTITGLGQSFLTLDGTNNLVDAGNTGGIGFPPPIMDRTRWFTIDDGNPNVDIDVIITDLQFQNSTEVTDVGAVIKSNENLTIERVRFVNNNTLGDGNSGGAIYQRNADLTLENVTVTAGRTDGVDADGGGIYVRDGNLTVQNSTISGNSTKQTQGSGGGIYLRNGTLQMNYSSVSGNTTPAGEADGAGIFGRNATLNIANSNISGNSMTGSNSEGGGIHSLNSQLTVTDSVVSVNVTTGTQSEGGGIYINGGSALIEDVIMSLNQTTGHTSFGAGIANVGGNVTVRTSTLINNKTTGDHSSGGGIFNLGGDVTVSDSTLSFNSVSGENAKGGGIYSDTDLAGNTTLVVNSTLSGNTTADRGGGIYNADGLTQIRYSTITLNEHESQLASVGAGVGSFGEVSTRTEVRSSIIAGNAGSDVDFVNGSFLNSFHSLGYNVVGNGLAVDEFTAVGDQTGVLDPMLGALLPNGGPTNTHLPMPGSPVIDAGDPSASAGVGLVPLFDQRGNFDLDQNLSRVRGPSIDVGAVETEPAGLAADFNDDGIVNGRDFLIWQTGFGIGDGASKSDGDANSDGAVNDADLVEVESMYGSVVDAAPAVAAAAIAPSDGPAEQLIELEDAGPNRRDPMRRPPRGLLGLPHDAGRIPARPVARRLAFREVNVAAHDVLLQQLAEQGEPNPLPVGDAEEHDEIALHHRPAQRNEPLSNALADDAVFEELGQ